ncbi:hypothetical protein D6D12_04701 [Aureobasidium pullulans]|nr:hypothetical protein D6D12_04701 [Aureobasidium pullulans]THX55735.1 hypothetical protein D6D11_03733 [Aureobasidium pullulans]
MVLGRLSSDSYSQVPDQRAGPLLPSYESLQNDENPSVNTHGVSDSNQSESGFNVSEHRKSHTMSMAQALTEQIRIKGWPEEPRKLRNKTLLTLFFNLCEALITLAPIAFIIFAILAAKLDGKPTNGNGLGHNIKIITRLVSYTYHTLVFYLCCTSVFNGTLVCREGHLPAGAVFPFHDTRDVHIPRPDLMLTCFKGPSIYPIMFAAVAGKSLKTVARYYAERGMKLGVLELLLASQTVWGTFESQVLLRRFTLFGARLFLLWCLSPLGGQASLRILETAMASQTAVGDPVLYLPTGGMSYHAIANDILMTGDAATPLAAINSLYSANLLAPASVKTSAVDTWGNIKVPRLSTVSAKSESTGHWKTVPELTSADNYTSLSGLPLAGLARKSQVFQEFTFEYAYMDLDCPEPAYNMSQRDPRFVQQLGLIWSPNNKSVFINEDKHTKTSFFLDTHTPMTEGRMSNIFLDQNQTTLTDTSLQFPRNVLFGSQYSGSDSRAYSVLMRNCTVKLKYVEVKAGCTEDGCRATALRPSTKYSDRNPNLTPLEYLVMSYHFMQDFPLATGSIHMGDTSPTEFYIKGASMPFGTATAGLPDMEDISNDLFATRMGSLMNTYFQLSLAPLAYTDDLPAPNDSIWKSSNLSITTSTELYDELRAPPYLPLYSNTTITATTEVYKCNYLWFAFLLVSSCILLLLGSAGTALSHLCHAPDMMGYVSSFTYNNPYMSVPSGGESLGAMERARLLRDVKVKIGDARVNDEVGHVVFATLNRADSIGDLSLKKHYR